VTGQIVKFRHRADSVKGMLDAVLAEDADDAVAVLVCGVTRDRLLFSHWYAGGHWAELLAAVETAKHEFLMEAEHNDRA